MADEKNKYPEPGTVPKLPQSIFYLENEGKRKAGQPAGKSEKHAVSKQTAGGRARRQRGLRRFVTRGGELVEVTLPPVHETR